ncbi:hypothetical protein BDN72DRAFT_332389 [Pluteus cervinus]|uniref:Uncharacterized protein n=1 Tax=Pluteus cervinus TaxID=181527 RepID=A0ACD3ABZ9_9AGAR|nr:hypothetical protein BDN72DRAFT_332389 [Pluteus cervinus]
MEERKMEVWKKEKRNRNRNGKNNWGNIPRKRPSRTHQVHSTCFSSMMHQPATEGHHLIMYLRLFPSSSSTPTQFQNRSHNNSVYSAPPSSSNSPPPEPPPPPPPPPLTHPPHIPNNSTVSIILLITLRRHC